MSATESAIDSIDLETATPAQIRRFLRFSEHAAREAGLEPQQYQLMLAVKGLPNGEQPRIGDIAAEKGVTAAQLALAWLLQRGHDIVPIPGTKRPDRLEENAKAAGIVLDPADIALLEAAASPENVRGDRHWDMAAIDR